ncbi:hypothetical protein RhiirA4_421853 [Rhizophagus irregularis]|uniref:Uncharacterized protein n=1 Tax=Rhizophagus irregularis TaxID=588596 RepID=A0A2I1GN00_9GLOM|nr:hypothetical protein RhiirA4_421853 [Rhizophagus irregularis]
MAIEGFAPVDSFIFTQCVWVRLGGVVSPRYSSKGEAGISEEEAESSQNVLRDNNEKLKVKNSQPNKKSKKTAFNNKNAPIIINEDPNNESDDKSLKINLKNIELSLIPNALPPGNSWIWFYFNQFVSIPPYKRIVKCLVKVQRENGMEECGHIMGTDSSTGLK